MNYQSDTMERTQHLQRVLLHMIKEIDALCREHNIHYYLLGGSALGAIRHKGFIPWDDDLDIIMDRENYDRFITICKSHLDSNKYYIQEALTDWPLAFSKIKLKGTSLIEYEGYDDGRGNGIYIDVFRFDNVVRNKFLAHWQYFCGKVYLCYTLAQRTYDSANLKKRLLMALSFPLKLSFVRKVFWRQITKYNKKPQYNYGMFFGRGNYRTAVVERRIFGTPTYLPFEDTVLPVPEQYHEYLSQTFGNYMQLPPEEKRQGLHCISVDFGEY